MQRVEVVDKRVLGSAIDVLARIQAYCTRMVLSRHVLSLAEQRWELVPAPGQGRTVASQLYGRVRVASPSRRRTQALCLRCSGVASSWS